MQIWSGCLYVSSLALSPGFFSGKWRLKSLRDFLHRTGRKRSLDFILNLSGSSWFILSREMNDLIFNHVLELKYS